MNTGAITMGMFGPAIFHLSGTGQVSATSLTVGEQSSGFFLQDSGSVTTNGGTLTVGTNADSSYAIKAGSVSTGGLVIGLIGAGSFRQAAGTVTLPPG